MPDLPKYIRPSWAMGRAWDHLNVFQVNALIHGYNFGRAVALYGEDADLDPEAEAFVGSSLFDVGHDLGMDSDPEDAEDDGDGVPESVSKSAEHPDDMPRWWIAERGDLAIPNSDDLREHSRATWQAAHGGSMDGWHEKPRRPVIVSQEDIELAEEGENPRTGAWWPYWVPWNPKTTPEEARKAMRRTQFKKSGADWRIDEARRRGGRKGGLSRSEAKIEAARMNARRGGRPRKTQTGPRVQSTRLSPAKLQQPQARNQASRRPRS